MRDARWRQAAQTVVALLIVAVLGVDIYVLTQRNATTQVDPEEVLADFRRSTRSTEPALAREPDGVEPIAPAAGHPDADVSVAPSLPGEVDDQVRHLTSSPAPAAPPAIGLPPADRGSPPSEMRELPPQGMYTYRTSGGERISVANASHDYPERTYATVRHLGGCHWEHRSEVIEEHVDERVLCTADGYHLQLVQARTVEFFGKKDSGRVTCEPPHLLHATRDAAATTTSRCRDGDDVEVHLVSTSLGRKTVSVGRRDVDVVGVRVEGRMTGRVEGDSTDELWLVASNGLTVSWERSVDTLADAAFGARVRYREEATFHLESLEPRR